MCMDPRVQIAAYSGPRWRGISEAFPTGSWMPLLFFLFFLFLLFLRQTVHLELPFPSARGFPACHRSSATCSPFASREWFAEGHRYGPDQLQRHAYGSQIGWKPGTARMMLEIRGERGGRVDDEVAELFRLEGDFWLPKVWQAFRGLLA